MTVNMERYNELKAAAAKATRAADRASGKLETLLASMKRAYGVLTVAEAEVLLKGLEEAATGAEEAYAQVLAEFEEEWGEVLDAAD